MLHAVSSTPDGQKDFAPGGAKFPRKLARRLAAAGANVTRECGQTLVCIDDAGGPAAKLYAEFLASLTDDAGPRRTTTFPRQLARRLAEAGANVTRECGETLVCIDDAGGPAAKLYTDFLASLTDAGPLLFVSAHFHAPQVTVECFHILHTYSRLRARDFAAAPGGLPPLPPIGDQQVVDARFHHCSRALATVASRICDPQDPSCPAIMALPPGTAIGLLIATFAGCTIVNLPLVRM